MVRVFAAGAILAVVSLSALAASPAPQAPAPAAARARSGAAIFAEQCAACHGADGRGLTGPNLTGLFASGRTEAAVLQILRTGVAGSIMPPTTATEDELRAIVAYLKGLGAPPPAAAGVESSARYVPRAPGADSVKLIADDGREIF